MTYMHRCHLCTDTYVHMYVYTHMFRWIHVYTPLLVLLSLSLSLSLSCGLPPIKDCGDGVVWCESAAKQGCRCKEVREGLRYEASNPKDQKPPKPTRTSQPSLWWRLYSSRFTMKALGSSLSA